MIARFPDLASEEPFLPHLTVGKLEAAKFASLLEEVNWQPLSFIVSVCLGWLFFLAGEMTSSLTTNL